MIKSFFVEYVDKLFSKLGALTETINGKKKGLVYLHKTMLRREFSADQKWESAALKTNFVAADVVSLNSPLPIKKRPSVSRASGKLPKIGIEKNLDESEINQINIMKAQPGTRWQQIAKKLSDNMLACSVGIDERNEANFLCALSNGYVLVDEDYNTGSAVRVSLGYLDENAFGVEKKGEISYEDIQRVIEKANADGNAITTIAIALSTYKKMKQSQWAKELVATYRGMTYTEETKLPTPTASVFDEAFADDNGGITFLKIDRSVIIEKNGVQKSYKPWNADHLIFLTSDQVGALVYGTPAEGTVDVAGVKHTTIDGFKLISEYAVVDPALLEVTKGQALCLPVIENVENIYLLDITDSDEDSQSSGDDVISWKGKNYAKSQVIAKLDSVLGIKVNPNITDADLLAQLNKLTKAQETKLLKELTPIPDPEESSSAE